MKKETIFVIIAFVIMLSFSIYSYVEMKSENKELRQQNQNIRIRIAADKTMTHFRDRIQDLTIQLVEETNPSSVNSVYNASDIVKRLEYLKDMDSKGLINYDPDKNMFSIFPAEDDSLYDKFFMRPPGQKTWRQRHLEVRLKD